MNTLSLADVARLSRVERPVVSMWRKRPKHGLHFPTPDADGRFPAEEVLSWLEQTERGNNPDARRDLALQAARSANSTISIEDTLVLLAARELAGTSLSEVDSEDLLDLVDTHDPDDAWLYSEVEGLDLDALAAGADAIADAAWSTADAYETLLGDLRARSAATCEPGSAVVQFMGDLARHLLNGGDLVDVAGTASDAVMALARAEDTEPSLVLPSSPDGVRAIRRRYAVHGMRPRVAAFDEDWTIPDGSVLLACLPTDPEAAFDLLDEVAIQLGGTNCAIVAGPASVLVDELPASWESKRDRFIRTPGRTLAAAVRLPQGLSRGHGREHLALWLMQPAASGQVRIGDLAGRRATSTIWQQLLDDLLAVASGVQLRAFALLDAVPMASLLAGRRSLVDHDGTTPEEWAPAPGDDAARMQHLLSALEAPIRHGFEAESPWVLGRWSARHVTLGGACRSRQVTAIPGTRLQDLPPGTTPVWSASPRLTRSASVDLLAFTEAHPNAQLTRPGDVVFVTDGQPRALVDAVGGAIVAYPARVLRVAAGQPLSPRAIAAAISALDRGNSKWRTWQVPVVAGDPTEAETALTRIDELASLLAERQTQVEELRRLVVRSVLPGSVAFRPRPNDVKGA